MPPRRRQASATRSASGKANSAYQPGLLPEVVAGLVAVLVREHGLELAFGEPAGQERVEDEDLPARPETGREGVLLRRVAVHVEYLHRDARESLLVLDALRGGRQRRVVVGE